MQREIERIEEMVWTLLNLVPKSEWGCDGKHAQKLLYSRILYKVGSTARHKNAIKALSAATRAVLNHMNGVAQSKDRVLEMAELVLQIAPAVLEGGQPRLVTLEPEEKVLQEV